VIAIITVNLNNAEGLRRTIESIDEQNYPGWRHYIQDGASVDESELIARSAPDSRRIWRSAQDSGVYDAMNRSRITAEGDLVWFLNSGDTFYDPKVLQKVAQSWERGEWLWAYGSLVIKIGAPDSWPLYRKINIRPSLVRLGIESFPHPATVYSKSLLDVIGDYRLEFGVSADQDLCLRAWGVAPPQFIDYRLSLFEPGGISTSGSARAHEEEFRRFRALRRELVMGNSTIDLVWSRMMIAARKTHNRFVSRR